ncbi:DUF6507 family protein [Kitasatospora sp. NBC_01266]|uniref:DUF6507 family protein n=1 Tax=Kitasatospora sp. NBC_01266 TaxID=2903572 RepID=UPI002E343B5F|nr:DUF6507 family protein [Kitasatospora sp. NBC_01266]
MAKWDIDPDGVRTVLVKTSQSFDSLAADAKSYGGHLESAATSAGGLTQPGQSGGSGNSSGDASKQPSGLVALALAQFAQAKDGELSFIAARAGKSMQGAVDATKAYLAGDDQMAADTQKAALTDPTVPPPGGGDTPASGKKAGK